MEKGDHYTKEKNLEKEKGALKVDKDQ